MSQEIKKPLNAGQQLAADGFFNFLFGTESELIISGPGGYGKTFLMGHLIDEVMPRYFETCKMMGIEPEYDGVFMTATTNKAAEVVAEATGRPSSTIHSHLGLRVQENFTTGKTSLTRIKNKWRIHGREILFIDECSMIDRALRTEIRTAMQGSKIVYVGDHSQLPPVFEDLSSIYLDELPFYNLTEPMRTDVPEIQAICQQYRDTVANLEFKDIQTYPGIIDWLDADAAAEAVEYFFVTNPGKNRIVAYSNDQVNGLNQYIRTMRQLPAEFVVGDELISNSAMMRADGASLSVEEPVTILEIGDTDVANLPGKVQLEYRLMKLETAFTTLEDVRVPVDMDHFNQLIKWYAGQKDWVTYFDLKGTYPDLRPKDACTVHKSQGSSYDTVFIDLENLSKCKQPGVAARLFYVAVSRARHRIVMYGQLAPRFGKVIV